ncbi:MAG: hotdog domain-containing protein [Bacteroidales bacterium]
MEAQTIQYKVIMHEDLNNHNTLFGGTALKWMDEAAYITASNLLKKKIVTAYVNKVKFLLPINLGDIIEISSKVVRICNAKIEIMVIIYLNDNNSNNKEKAIEGLFTLAALNDQNKPVIIRIPEEEKMQ